MGSGASRPEPEEKPKRPRATRKKNDNETNEKEKKNKNKNENIQGSPSMQLKRIQELACDATKKYENMDTKDIGKLLNTIRRLSTVKLANA
jgi:hypothetical protein